MDWISSAILLGYFIGLLALANSQDKGLKKAVRQVLTYPFSVTTVEEDTPATSTRWLLLLRAMLLTLVVGIFVYGAIGLYARTMPPLPTGEALLDPLPTEQNAQYALVVGSLAALWGGAILFSGALRRGIQRAIGQSGTFNADSWVHRLALVLAICVTTSTLIDYLLLGGLEGVAQNLDAQSVNVQLTLLNLALLLVAAAFGVGLFVRRSVLETLQRLGLRRPTTADILWGTGMAFFMLGIAFVFGLSLTLFQTPEQIAAQSSASQELARALSGSFLLVFAASISAAVGEEILFRGALQPVFGLIPTTIFFALIHSQYTFTPSSLVIIVVGGLLGWLKNRQSTTAAIIAHFLYNFVQLALLFLVIQLEQSGFFPIPTPEAIIVGFRALFG
ncbi:MAG: CPBP family intramembrane glutamic endopeptidase [Phototrophicaceae bacterium]|jgi:membrane protease YdiL (CAAX protease family)